MFTNDLKTATYVFKKYMMGGKESNKEEKRMKGAEREDKENVRRKKANKGRENFQNQKIHYALFFRRAFAHAISPAWKISTFSPALVSHPGTLFWLLLFALQVRLDMTSPRQTFALRVPRIFCSPIAKSPDSTVIAYLLDCTATLGPIGLRILFTLIITVFPAPDPVLSTYLGGQMNE